jgi:hypothetical protein
VSERWIPIFAAVVGVLGGMGGAYIGGYVANEGQQQRFESEQDARLQDLRRDAYADFVEEAANVEFKADKGENPVDKLLGAEAKAGLYADSDIQNAATALSDVVREEDPDSETPYEQRVGQFVDEARTQLEKDE